MKKKLLTISIAVVALILMIVYYFPQSLSKIVIADSKITIIQRTTDISNDGTPIVESPSYEFEPKTNEHDMVMEIFNKYSYRRNLRSFFNTSGMSHNSFFSFDIYSDIGSSNKISFIGGKNGEILVDNHIYTIGIGGEAKQAKLMEELKTFLSSQIPVAQSY